MATIITQGVEYQQLLDDLRALIRHEMSLAKPLVAESQQPTGDELLTIKQAAELLNVCVATVHSWKQRGILEYRKIGGRSYLNRVAVLAAGSREQRSHKPARARSG